jgi:hypothetical protein
MNREWRSTTMFAAGAIAGGAVVFAAWMTWFAPHERPAPPVRTFATAPQPAAQPLASAPLPQVQQAAAAASSCPSQPLAIAKSDGDGQFLLQAALSSGSKADPGAFLAVAKEAAEQGRVRDAEVALMAACHAAEQEAGGQSAPVADVKSQMGQHYVILAAEESADSAREGLLQRASSLFAESASAYAAALGKNASKTRMAEQRLASVREPETLRAALRQRPMARATEVSVEQPVQDGDAEPRSTRAMGSAAALVRSDPDLARIDRDLQRLHAQASSVSRDPSGMRQRDERAFAQRDACRDEGCLRRWYAQRRAQLLDEF